MVSCTTVCIHSSMQCSCSLLCEFYSKSEGFSFILTNPIFTGAVMTKITLSSVISGLMDKRLAYWWSDADRGKSKYSEKTL
jgi:hypothetical protein